MKTPRVLYGGAGYGGKAGYNESMVCTPFGFRKMKDLKVGSMVCSTDGSINTVIAVHPQGEKDIFEVSFTDGTSYQCTEDHLWLCRRRTGNTKKDFDWRIKTTSQLRPGMALPCPAPVIFTRTSRWGQVTLDPYLIGVVLGDGGCTGQGIVLTCFDKEIVKRLESKGVPIYAMSQAGHYRVSIKESSKEWKRLGILGKKSPDKRIPTECLHWPADKRLELLQGLMDTDGTADKDGGVTFCSSSKGLAEDVAWLVRSLGGVARISNKKTKCLPAYIVALSVPRPEEAFFLLRKRLRVSRERPLEKTIKAIKFLFKGEAQCITVDHPNGLYLGDDFIVTHNSYAIRSAAVELNGTLRDLGYPARWGAIFCADYPKLMDRHGSKIAQELSKFGRIKESRIHGLHFAFDDPTLGGFYLRNAADPRSYRGIEYDWILFDELTEILRDDFDSLMYTLRSNVKGGLPFESFGAATNPDGPGHGWVKDLWINKYFEGESEGIKALEDQFVFIPARAPDNPVFSASIAAKLQGFSDPAMVKARWEGSWDLASGARWAQFRRPIHLFSWDEFKAWYGGKHEPEVLLRNPDLFGIFGSLDYGTDIKAASCFLIYAVDWKGKIWCIHEQYMQGMYLREQADIIRELVNIWGIERIYADPSLDTTESDGMSRRIKFKQNGVLLFMAVNDRVEGWASIDRALDFMVDPLDGSVSHPPILHIHEGCKNLVRQVATAPRDERRVEDLSRQFRDDHAVDSLRYFIHSFFQSPRGPSGDPVEIAREGWRRRNLDANIGNQES